MKVAESMKWKWRSMMKYPCYHVLLWVSHIPLPFFGNMRTKPVKHVKPNLLQAWCQGVARDSQELRATRGGKLGYPVPSQCCWFSGVFSQWDVVDLDGSRWLRGIWVDNSVPMLPIKRPSTDCYRLLAVAGTVEPKVITITEIRKVWNDL